MEEKEVQNAGLARINAKELEELFISRFEKNFHEFRPFGQVFHPLEQTFYSANASNNEGYRSNSYRKIIDLMKKHKLFDRNILEEMPLQEISRFEIYRKSLFGKATPKVVVAAICVNPLEDLLLGKAPSPLGAKEIEEGVQKVVREKNVYYYIGIGSTSGWEEKVWSQDFKGVNWICGILEPVEGSYWKKRFPDPDNWYGLEPVFDPEMDSEKLERCKGSIIHHPELRLKGSHKLLDDLYREADVPEYIFVQALSELLESYPEFEIKEISGKKILQKKRI